MRERCRVCRREYSVAPETLVEREVFICQDCEERALARIQRRPARLIYGNGDLARVVIRK